MSHSVLSSRREGSSREVISASLHVGEKLEYNENETRSEKRSILRPMTSFSFYPNTKSDESFETTKGNTVNYRRRHQPRSLSVDNFEMSPQISSLERLFLKPNWNASKRAGLSVSPLAQYDNGFYNFFGSNVNARIYRTPIPPTRSPKDNNFSGTTSSKRISVLPIATSWGSATNDYSAAVYIRKHDDVIIPALTTANGMKSAMRTESNSAGRTSKQNLRVSFDESSHEEVASRSGGAPPSRTKGSDRHIDEKLKRNLKIQKGFRRRHTIVSILHSKAYSDVSDSKTKNHPNHHRFDQLEDDSSNTTTSGSGRPSRTDYTAQQMNRKNHAPQTKNPPSSSKCSKTRRYLTLRTASPPDDSTESLMVLTADQLLVRKSVEKVQRWIEKLPRHFTTTHHILPPVQQD